jgi:hypothetical protein
MRPVRVTVSSVTASNPIPLDINQAPFSVGLATNLVSGTATWTVQYTFDDVWASTFTPASAVWFNHPSMTDKVANTDSNLAYPCTAVRLNVTIVGPGSVQLTVIQATKT